VDDCRGDGKGRVGEIQVRDDTCGDAQRVRRESEDNEGHDIARP
jgi:hypothetical protein